VAHELPSTNVAHDPTILPKNKINITGTTSDQSGTLAATQEELNLTVTQSAFLDKNKQGRDNTIGIGVGVTVALALVVVLVIAMWCICRRRRQSRGHYQ